MRGFFAGCAATIALAAFLLSACERKPAPAQPAAAAPNPDRSARTGRVTIEYDVRPSILFEAECGEVRAPVQLFEDSAASGGKYALAPEGPDHKEINKGGDVTYTLQVPEGGEYVMWVRAKWSGACGDSLGVLLDGSALGAVGDSVYETWHWVRLGRRKVQLAAGEHSLVITNREDGSAFDQVLLTQDPDYRPTGIEKPDVKGRTQLNKLPPGPPAK